MTLIDRRSAVCDFLNETYGRGWTYHFDAMFNSYCCAKETNCGGLVRPGDNYYRNQAQGITMHLGCALTKYRAYHEGEDNADVRPEVPQVRSRIREVPGDE